MLSLICKAYIVPYMTLSKKILVVVGTNASGKSSLAVLLAKKHAGEVLSADSRQVYTGLDIATGKTTKEEMDGIPHHLIDIADPTTQYTAADFARDGRAVLKELFSRNVLPIIAGGTGFYIDMLLNPSVLPHVPPNADLRTGFEALPTEKLFSQLEKLNPERAQDLKEKGEQHLKRRIIRALEITIAQGQPIIAPKAIDLPPLEVLWIGLKWDNETLKQRIHERTLARLEAGMIEEAANLHTSGLSWERMEELGLEYKHLADHLRGLITKKELVANIERDDWKYAKRQRTWFKRNENIHWFDATDVKGIEKEVESFLSGQ